MISELLSVLLKLVGFDYQNKRAKDKVLLEEFLSVLPTNSSAIDLLRLKDVGAPIHHQCFTPLDNVADLWMAPDKIFQVKKLEKLKIIFIDALDVFLNEYAKHSAISNGRLSIGIRDYEERSDKLKTQKELNSLARTAYNKYEKFVKTAKREI